MAPKIEHIFVLALENRSFDHMLGFSGITGIDINGNTTPFNEGFSPAINFNIDPATNSKVYVTAPTDFQLYNVDQDPGHEFEDTLTVLCGKDAMYDPVLGGYPVINNSGFIQNYCSPKDRYTKPSITPQRIMTCFSNQQLPVLNALAREFAICDRWFSSMPGPTWPNRFFLLAATSGGLDDSPGTLDIIKGTTVEGYSFENGNIFDLLDENKIDWKIFRGDDFPVSFALKGMNLNEIKGRFKGFDDFKAELNSEEFSEKFIFIEPKYGSHSFDIGGPGNFTCGNSMHPLDDVTSGEKLIKEVYETIRNSPLWETSMLLITFDEHGGFYDHVAPPATVPPGDLDTGKYRKKYPAGLPQAGQLINFQFDQLGVRVPALVISPYTQKGVIDHTIYDHTSMLATVERLFAMKNLTNRDKAANDLLHLFSLSNPRTDTPTILPDPASNPNPLSCNENDETQDTLFAKSVELRTAKQNGIYKERKVSEIRLTPSQIGFNQIALLKVLQSAGDQERVQWIQQYKEIATGIDSAIFMTEAKLKVKHSIDLKK
jgi:phospholipase C